MIEAGREKICIHRLVANKKEIIICEGDMIVPDSKPDILNTICTSGIVSIYKKEVGDNKVRVDGNLNIYVMYLSEDSNGKTRALNPSLDFSENINVPNCSSDMNLELDSKIKSIECKVVNGRKISVKVAVELEIKLYSDEEIDIVNSILNQDNIKVLKKETKINSLVAVKENKVFAKDTILIDNVDNLAEILKASVNICNEDIKISYNKVLAKAEAEFKIVYLTEDNRIKPVTTKIPLVGFIDIPNITEENICDVNYQIQNIILKPNSIEEHSIYVELEVMACCRVYEEKNINLIQDLYSTKKEINFKEKQVNAIINRNNIKENKTIRENVKLKDMRNKKMIDVDVLASITKQNKLNSAIMFEGDLEFRFILEENQEITIQVINVPFQHAFENLSDLDTVNNVKINIKSQDFIIGEEGNITCNIEIELILDSYKNTKLNVIDEIEEIGDREEQECYYVYNEKRRYSMENCKKIWQYSRTNCRNK